MPRGHHFGRQGLRAYTSEYQRLYAHNFKSLLVSSLGAYTIDSNSLSTEHKRLQLTESDTGIRLMTFTINDKPHQIALKLDNSSASNKLYLTCPYCQEQRQHLYAIKYAYVCRSCIGLQYACQSERPKERLMRRIRKLRIELWGYDWPEINNMFEQVTYWQKPKWMRWKTFLLKRDKITELEGRYWGLAIPQFKTIFGDQFMPNI
jgi:hypothetical protein